PFLGRSMGNQADYSLEVAHEIDEEVRKLIEAAHTEAWEILNTYRDVLDELVLELLEKETLTRKDLTRIFDSVEKRPRITAFNDFGQRTPSDKPPILTPAERAHENGEPWPPQTEPEREPTPVGSYPGGSNGAGGPGPDGGSPVPTPGTGHPGQQAYPSNGGSAPQNGGYSAAPQNGGYPAAPPNAVAPNYGAPPNWRPATTPAGQTWPPPNWTEQTPQGQNGPAQNGPWSTPGQQPGGTGNGNGQGHGPSTEQQRPQDGGPNPEAGR
ncbi:MAG: cell division protein FtsH, partial [Pseudonocardia sediminis]